MKRFSLRNTVEAFPAAADVKALKPLSIIGGLYAMTLDMFVAMVKPPFPWREFLLQTWFVARVSMVPALTLSIPLVVLTSFTFNTLLLEFGAADFSGGTGAALGAVNQIGPFVTVLVVAGAGASAICADLGSRTIREEVDAMRVLGLDPIHSLVVPPRVLATTTVAVLLSSVVTVTGLLGAFYFFGLLPARDTRVVRREHDADHRPQRCLGLFSQGHVIRFRGRSDCLLPGLACAKKARPASVMRSTRRL